MAQGTCEPTWPRAGCHIIDACQLLNKSRSFKYAAATLQTLAEIVELCRNRIVTRLGLYRWLVFNVLIANTDNHLKNLSFLVGPEGIEARPCVRSIEHRYVSHPRLRE